MNQTWISVVCGIVFLGLPLLSQVAAIEIPEKTSPRLQPIVQRSHERVVERPLPFQHLTARQYLPSAQADTLLKNLPAAASLPPQRLFRLYGR